MENEIMGVLHKIADFAVGFAKELITAPPIIRQWSEKASVNRVIVLAAAAAAAVMLLAAIISTVRTLIKMHKLSLFSVVFVLILICVGMWIARGQILAYQIPEAETVRINGEEILVNPRYSLSRGTAETEPTFFVLASWFLSDDTIALKVSEDAVMQLNGLHAIAENRLFQWNGISRGVDISRLEAVCWTGADDGGTICSRLYLFVYPDVQLSEEEWFLDAGAKGEVNTEHFGCIGTDSDGVLRKMSENVAYEILENTGDRILLAAKTHWKDNQLLCMAQQMGEYMVVLCSDAFYRRAEDSGTSNDKYYAPVTDLRERAYLLEPLSALFDGGIRLLQGLSEDQISLLLPDRIVDYPIRFSLNTSHFSIPCTELMRMDYEDIPFESGYYAPTLRFKGTDPDGNPCIYSLINGGEAHEWNATGYTEPLGNDWNRVYRSKEAVVDPEMSEFIGIKAVCYQNGWLLCVGSVDANGNYKQYYHLSMEPAD